MIDSNSTNKSNKSIERVYNYVKNYIRENAMSPSVRDICIGSGLKSTSSVHTYLKKLDSLGLIEYRPGMRRAIIIKDMSVNSVNDNSSDSEPVQSNIESANVVKLSCLGKITAGIPIYAHEDFSNSFYVDKSIIGNEECFLLKVSGNSMINAHICDGDYLIIRKQSFCDEGDIIAALIGDEATVKRYGRLNGTPYLFPENDMYSPIPFNTEECRILGKVVGLHRYSIN
ncbi:MAG: transcriptional repressor LexA [Clostridia bacterium]|nr:transcriptional repressor LexA [Clostridia bacterium]